MYVTIKVTLYAEIFWNFTKKLKQDGRHNYICLQVPVMSNLKYEKWAQYLTIYWDWQLPLLIKYGFPLDFDRNSDIVCAKINHKSAIEYSEHVAAYLQEELDHKAMLGPFRTPPIDNLHISPFMTRDKSSSVNRRVIIDPLDILLTRRWGVIVTWVLNSSSRTPPLIISLMKS